MDSTDPQEIIQKGLDDKKITVWGGFIVDFIIRSCFFEKIHCLHYLSNRIVVNLICQKNIISKL